MKRLTKIALSLVIAATTMVATATVFAAPIGEGEAEKLAQYRAAKAAKEEISVEAEVETEISDTKASLHQSELLVCDDGEKIQKMKEEKAAREGVFIAIPCDIPASNLLEADKVLDRLPSEAVRLLQDAGWMFVLTDDSLGEGVLGAIDTESKYIRIKNTEEAINESLIHTVFHAYSVEAKLDLEQAVPEWANEYNSLMESGHGGPYYADSAEEYFAIAANEFYNEDSDGQCGMFQAAPKTISYLRKHVGEEVCG